MEVRILRGHEVHEANCLIMKIFDKYIAVDCLKERQQALNDENILALMKAGMLLE